MQDLFEIDYGMPGLAGVDEAGRGPLAGDVLAAAVVLDPARPIDGLRDSKRLAPLQRDRLAGQIMDRALGWSVARATVAEIDSLNILQATLLAMQRAVQALDPQPHYVLVDGNQLPRWHYASQPVVGGDDLVPAISAASILAKVHRDRELVELDRRFPGYGFAAHKGYATSGHLQALRRLGVTPLHRRSFAPVLALLQGTAGRRRRPPRAAGQADSEPAVSPAGPSPPGGDGAP